MCQTVEPEDADDVTVTGINYKTKNRAKDIIYHSSDNPVRYQCNFPFGWCSRYNAKARILRRFLHSYADKTTKNYHIITLQKPKSSVKPNVPQGSFAASAAHVLVQNMCNQNIQPERRRGPKNKAHETIKPKELNNQSQTTQKQRNQKQQHNQQQHQQQQQNNKTTTTNIPSTVLLRGLLDNVFFW